MAPPSKPGVGLRPPSGASPQELFSPKRCQVRRASPSRRPRLAPQLAGAGGIEPPLRGPKPRVLPLDDAPSSSRPGYTTRIAGPEWVRTAQQAQSARLTRRRIWRAWAGVRAIPTNVGPLPVITAHIAP